MQQRVLQVLCGLALLIVCLAPSALAADLTENLVEKPLFHEVALPRLETVNVNYEKHEIEVEMVFNQLIDFTSFRLGHPERIVIDVRGGWYKNLFTQLDQRDWLLRQVRIFHNRVGLRIVAELNYAGPWYEILWDEETLTLKLIIHREFTNVETSTITNGVKYHQIKRGLPEGLVVAKALEVEVPYMSEGRKILEEMGTTYPEPVLQLKTAFHQGGIQGLTRVSDLVKQEGGFAGINGGYFAGDGFPLGLLIQDGQLVAPPLYNRTAWGLDRDGKMHIDQVTLKLELEINGRVYAGSGFNRVRGADELVIYSAAFGKRTQTNQWGAEATVVDGRVTQVAVNNSEIPTTGWVLSAHGKYKSLIEGLKPGDIVKVRVELVPDWLAAGVVEAIGGGPRLLVDGRVAISGKEEQFKSDILSGRAPRTALGITPENHLIMLVVDGRSKFSIGMSLTEVAELLRYLGAEQAMNLDGGKSSTLVIGGQIHNSPSAGSEIKVHNGLILITEPLVDFE